MGRGTRESVLIKHLVQDALSPEFLESQKKKVRQCHDCKSYTTYSKNGVWYWYRYGVAWKCHICRSRDYWRMKHNVKEESFRSRYR